MIASYPTQASDVVNILSRLSTSNDLAHMFKNYASFVDASIRRRTAGITSMGIDLDDMRELANDLWTIHDGYPAGGDDSDSGDIGGSDGE